MVSPTDMIMRNRLYSPKSTYVLSKYSRMRTMAMFIKLLAMRIVASRRSGRSSSEAIILSRWSREFLNSSFSAPVMEKRAVSEPDIRADVIRSKITAIEYHRALLLVMLYM